MLNTNNCVHLYQCTGVGRRNYSDSPTGLLFDTYYFYVMSSTFQATGTTLNVDAYYRLDRFDTYGQKVAILLIVWRTLEERYSANEQPLMQIGKTIQVEFDYTGLISAALDKFPNAKIYVKEPQISPLEFAFLQ